MSRSPSASSLVGTVKGANGGPSLFARFRAEQQQRNGTANSRDDIESFDNSGNNGSSQQSSRPLDAIRAGNGVINAGGTNQAEVGRGGDGTPVGLISSHKRWNDDDDDMPNEGVSIAVKDLRSVSVASSSSSIPASEASSHGKSSNAHVSSVYGAPSGTNYSSAVYPAPASSSSAFPPSFSKSAVTQACVDLIYDFKDDHLVPMLLCHDNTGNRNSENDSGHSGIVDQYPPLGCILWLVFTVGSDDAHPPTIPQHSSGRMTAESMHLLMKLMRTTIQTTDGPHRISLKKASVVPISEFTSPESDSSGGGGANANTRSIMIMHEEALSAHKELSMLALMRRQMDEAVKNKNTQSAVGYHSHNHRDFGKYNGINFAPPFVCWFVVENDNDNGKPVVSQVTLIEGNLSQTTSGVNDNPIAHLTESGSNGSHHQSMPALSSYLLNHQDNNIDNNHATDRYVAAQRSEGSRDAYGDGYDEGRYKPQHETMYGNEQDLSEFERLMMMPNPPPRRPSSIDPENKPASVSQPQQQQAQIASHHSLPVSPLKARPAEELYFISGGTDDENSPIQSQQERIFNGTSTLEVIPTSKEGGLFEAGEDPSTYELEKDGRPSIRHPEITVVSETYPNGISMPHGNDELHLKSETASPSSPLEHVSTTPLQNETSSQMPFSHSALVNPSRSSSAVAGDYATITTAKVGTISDVDIRPISNDTIEVNSTLPLISRPSSSSAIGVFLTEMKERFDVEGPTPAAHEHLKTHFVEFHTSNAKKNNNDNNHPFTQNRRSGSSAVTGPSSDEFFHDKLKGDSDEEIRQDNIHAHWQQQRENSRSGAKGDQRNDSFASNGNGGRGYSTGISSAAAPQLSQLEAVQQKQAERIVSLEGIVVSQQEAIEELSYQVDALTSECEGQRDTMTRMSTDIRDLKDMVLNMSEMMAQMKTAAANQQQQLQEQIKTLVFERNEPDNSHTVSSSSSHAVQQHTSVNANGHRISPSSVTAKPTSATLSASKTNSRGNSVAAADIDYQNNTAPATPNASCILPPMSTSSAVANTVDSVTTSVQGVVRSRSAVNNSSLVSNTQHATKATAPPSITSSFLQEVGDIPFSTDGAPPNPNPQQPPPLQASSSAVNNSMIAFQRRQGQQFEYDHHRSQQQYQPQQQQGYHRTGSGLKTPALMTTPQQHNHIRSVNHLNFAGKDKENNNNFVNNNSVSQTHNNSMLYPLGVRSGVAVVNPMNSSLVLSSSYYSGGNDNVRENHTLTKMSENLVAGVPHATAKSSSLVDMLKILEAKHSSSSAIL